MIAVFLGPPGSGKGTQAGYLEKNKGFVRISTGDLLRAEIKQQTDLGIKIQEIVESGGFVSDSILYDLMRKSLGNTTGSYLFDGFPRNIAQADFFETLLVEKKMSVGKVIYFDLKDEDIITRLSSRYICSSCGATYNVVTNHSKTDSVCDVCGEKKLMRRKDDDPESVRYRLHVYHEQTAPLVAYYAQKGNLVRLDASHDPQMVCEEVEQILFSETKMKIAKDI
jgi:adenylate kinase